MSNIRPIVDPKVAPLMSLALDLVASAAPPRVNEAPPLDPADVPACMRPDCSPPSAETLKKLGVKP